MSKTLLNATSSHKNATRGLFIEEDEEEEINWIYLFLYLIPVGTIAGNVFVCMAVFIEKRLRNGFNLFLVSLAVSDMLCAALVMPYSATKVIFNIKTSREVCLIWYSLDIFFTSTTIIHLCTISLDRYLVLRKPLQYGPNRDAIDCTFCGKISLAWLISFFIAGPLFLIAMKIDTSERGIVMRRGKENETNISYKGCGPNDATFVLTATGVTFLLPLIIMIITYLLTINTLARQMNQARKARLYCDQTIRPIGNFHSLKRTMTVNRERITGFMESKRRRRKRSGDDSEDGRRPGLLFGSRKEKRKSIIIVNMVASEEDQLENHSNSTVKRDEIHMDMAGPRNGGPPQITFSKDSTPSEKGRERLTFQGAVKKVRLQNMKKKAKDGHKFELWRMVKEYREFLEMEDLKLETEWALSSLETDELESPLKKTALKESSARQSPYKDRLDCEMIPRKTQSARLDLPPQAKKAFGLNRESIRYGVRQLRTFSGKEHSTEKRNMERIHKGKRAMQVIGVLFGVFITCYTPFFALYLTVVFCKECKWAFNWIGLIEWLGYIGSMLNPFVYHFFNPAFRRTFRRMLHCDYSKVKHVPGMSLKNGSSGYINNSSPRRDDFSKRLEKM